MNKTVSLIGETRETTIIDGNRSETVVYVTANDVLISNFTIQQSGSDSFDSGIMVKASYCNITSNLLTENWYGIFLNYSSNNNLYSNNVTNNYRGVWLWHSADNTLRNNNIADNRRNFGVWGKILSDFINDVDLSNTVDEKKIYYLINQSRLTVPLDAGYIALIDCTDITVETLTLENNGQGILLAYTSRSSIVQNTLKGNDYGVYLYSSWFNLIYRNNITANKYDGVHSYPYYNYYKLFNFIFLNNLMNNDYGVYSYRSQGDVIDTNYIANNTYGIKLYQSSESLITKNNITSNGYGVFILDSSSNRFYHNNFMDNINQTYVSPERPNTWDDGYPSGGNYWSDYTDMDLYKGSNQDEVGSDGIWDNPYVIDADNIDRYPLMKPYSLHDIAILSVTASKSVVGQGYTLNINLITVSYGEYVETDIIVYANSSTIANRTHRLGPISWKTVIKWNTTGWAKGNYTISAYAIPIPSETHIADNNFTDGWVIVAMVGDITGPEGYPDGKSNIRDITVAARAFGSYPGHPRWNPNADITGPLEGFPDYKVDMRDITLIAKHFGETDP